MLHFTPPRIIKYPDMIKNTLTPTFPPKDMNWTRRVFGVTWLKSMTSMKPELTQ